MLLKNGGVRQCTTARFGMGMILQEAEIRSYRLFVFHRPEDGKWEFWIRKNDSLIAQGIGSDSCTDTKLLAQNHLYQLLMNKTEKKHFNPVELLDWKNALERIPPGDRAAGKPKT